MSQKRLTVKERVRNRKPEAEEGLIEELILTAMDRILLKGGILLEADEDFPQELDSIAVEIVVAMINKAEVDHEGVETEQVDSWRMKYISDLIAPYLDEIHNYKKMRDERKGTTKKVVFL